jgi:predicted ATPase/class 3 adenylate cyclase
MDLCALTLDRELALLFTSGVDVLPEGTVSLLFSDIEGSTRLLTRLGAEYATALDVHRRILRESWAAYSGSELGTEGDSFYVVFARATDAVEAAVMAQRGLAGESWPRGEMVRVRIGIHTGTPLRHRDAYVGMDVHRAARIAAAAHGGQILVSDATAVLLARGNGELRDLGRHTMKDLPEPEHLYQVLADGLECDFPAVRSLGSASNLPRPATPLIGREEVVAQLVQLANQPDNGLLTLTGPGGSGKTRLAIALAEAMAVQNPDGVYFAALESVTSPEMMWTTVASALDLPPEGRAPPAIYDHLAHRAALLVLDNLEQVQDAFLVVAELRRVAPSLRLLVTSRHPLHVSGELEFPVPPLDLPDSDELTAVRRAGAVELFMSQARRLRPGLELDGGNAATVRALVTALDGLPLALELVAARTGLLSPAALLARLDKVLDLTSRDRTRSARHQTLRQTIGWSYDLLEDRQRTLLRLLGVFAGGAGIDTVQAVGGRLGMDPEEVLDDLDILLDASLVTVTDRTDGEPRIGLLHTVQAFAVEALAAEGEDESTRAAAAAQFGDLLIRYDEEADYLESLLRQSLVEDDLDNYRRTLTWLLQPGPEDENVRVDKVERARVMAAWLTILLLGVRNDLDEAWEWCERARAASADTETPAALSCQLALAQVLTERGERASAAALLDQALPMLLAAQPTEHVPERLLAGTQLPALNLRAWLALDLDDPDRARELATKAQSLAHTPTAQIGVILTLADIDDYEGKDDSALRRRQEVMPTLEAVGFENAVVNNRVNIAFNLYRMGRPNEALTNLRDSTTGVIASRTPSLLAFFADLYASVLVQLDHPRNAARLVGAVNAMRTQHNIPRTPYTDALAVEAGRAQLGDTWSQLEAAGSTETIEEVLAGIERSTEHNSR